MHLQMSKENTSNGIDSHWSLSGVLIPAVKILSMCMPAVKILSMHVVYISHPTCVMSYTIVQSLVAQCMGVSKAPTVQ